MRLAREEMRLAREQHGDLRRFIQEINIRGERMVERFIAQLDAMQEERRAELRAVRAELRRGAVELRDLRADSRAHTQALLRMIDRLGPGPASA